MYIKFLPFANIAHPTGFRKCKEFIKILLFRAVPKLISFVINVLPSFSSSIVFVRADCDHFGSWQHVFMVYAYMKPRLENVCIVVCAKKGTIDKHWLKYLENSSIRIIYNQYLQLLFAPFFHSKYALDVNGHIILGNQSSFLGNIPRLPTFTAEFIASTSNYLKNNVFDHDQQDLSSLNLDEKRYILFYARSGNWPHSSGKSKRNMPDDLANIIIKNILKNNLSVILIGDTPRYLTTISNLIFHIDQFHVSSLASIYSGALAVIGSGSGATHFPSFLFNLPALTFTSKPLYHLDAMYMLPTVSNPFTQTIPLKDKWVMASELTRREVLEETPALIDYFLSDQNLLNLDEHLNNPFPLIYTNIHSPISRTLAKTDQGNIIII